MFYSCEKSFWENIWYSHWEIFILFTIQECDSVANLWYPISALLSMGVARIFQRGHTESYRGYSPDCQLNIVGCLLTKRFTKGGSHAPQDLPGYAIVIYQTVAYKRLKTIIMEKFKLFAVTYNRWLLRRGSKYSDLIGKLLVLWKTGHLGELFTYYRWQFNFMILMLQEVFHWSFMKRHSCHVVASIHDGHLENVAQWY